MNTLNKMLIRIAKNMILNFKSTVSILSSKDLSTSLFRSSSMIFFVCIGHHSFWKDVFEEALSTVFGLVVFNTFADWASAYGLTTTFTFLSFHIT